MHLYICTSALQQFLYLYTFQLVDGSVLGAYMMSIYKVQTRRGKGDW